MNPNQPVLIRMYWLLPEPKEYILEKVYGLVFTTKLMKGNSLMKVMEDQLLGKIGTKMSPTTMVKEKIVSILLMVYMDVVDSGMI